MTAPQTILRLTGEEHEVMLALLADLRYPVDTDGNIWCVEYLRPVIAYHLTRAGWRPDMTRRRIKARKVYGPGVYEDAITWIGVDEPDDPLANLPNMTMGEIELLPDDVKLEAKRRLGIPVEAPKQAEPWHTTTRIDITDAPDEDDD